MPKRAVLLLSGGLDSCTAGAIAKDAGYELYALSFDYAQRHRNELDHARRVGEALGVAEHKVLELSLGSLGGSALTDDAIPVEDSPTDPKDIGQNIPTTYVPARNTLFLSFALAYAEVVQADTIFIGANALDYSGYPDCRPEYLQAFQTLADLATKQGVEGHGPKIEAPLLTMTKAEIIERAVALRAPLQETWSCYRGGERACGTCESCTLRLKGFERAGHPDPVPYLEV